MEVIVVRHGRPEIERRAEGIADPGLDPHGVWQAERVSTWLAHEAVDAIVASPKARACDTIRPLARHLGLDIEVEPGFDEIDRNSPVYVPTDLWATHGQDLLTALGEGRYAEIGYDAPEEFTERIHATWRHFVERRPGRTVVLACHGGTIREILRAVLGEAAPSFHVRVEYASITRIRVEQHRSVVVSINETGHFDADRIAMRGPMYLAPTMET